MHYMTAALNRVKYPLAPVEDFTSLFTKTRIIRDSILEISRDKLPEKTEILVMNHTY